MPTSIKAFNNFTVPCKVKINGIDHIIKPGRTVDLTLMEKEKLPYLDLSAEPMLELATKEAIDEIAIDALKGEQIYHRWWLDLLIDSEGEEFKNLDIIGSVILRCNQCSFDSCLFGNQLLIKSSKHTTVRECHIGGEIFIDKSKVCMLTSCLCEGKLTISGSDGCSIISNHFTGQGKLLPNLMRKPTSIKLPRRNKNLLMSGNLTT